MDDLRALVANRAKFTFRFQHGDSTGLDPFGVYAFSGQEEVSRPYSFAIELVSRQANVDIPSLLGTPVLLSIGDRSCETRKPWP